MSSTLPLFRAFTPSDLHMGCAAEITELMVSKGAVETCIEMVNAGTNPYISQCALTTMANLLNADGANSLTLCANPHSFGI